MDYSPNCKFVIDGLLGLYTAAEQDYIMEIEKGPIQAASYVELMGMFLQGVKGLVEKSLERMPTEMQVEAVRVLREKTNV